MRRAFISPSPPSLPLFPLYLLLFFFRQNCRTAAHWAAVKGHNEILEYLLKINNGCEQQLRAEEGKTFLHLAAENGRLQAVQLLLQHDYCDISATDAVSSIVFCQY